VDPAGLAEACCRGGAALLQVRQKTAGSGRLLGLVREIQRRVRPYGARVIVNDRADLARLSAADGVHLGQEDLPVAAARAITGPGPLIGLSTHTPEQVDQALASDVDYVAVGPVFRTATKETGYSARGLDLVRYASRGGGKPVVAIGGITVDGAPAVRAAGADTVAVISDLLAGDDPEARVREYLRVLGI
jgi:thiamine-phosphate pyrophosphorylase